MQHTHSVQFADSQAPFDIVAKNGYHQVGDHFFNHKVNALVYATKTNQPVQWHFNDHIWKKFNWQYDDSMSLDYWYCQRAKQLREKYDYLILAFSGGRDSHNVLRSFVDNGIHLDEVWCDWPLTHTHGKCDNDPHNQSAANMPSEWTFAIRPELDWLAKTHPKVKITITDSTRDLAEEYQEDSLVISQYAFYATIKRWRVADSVIQERNKKHRRVGLIAAFEKPYYSMINGYMAIQFHDYNFQIKSDSIRDGTRDVEYFYWSADLPELIRCQAHTILKYLQSHKQAQTFQYYGIIDKTNAVQVLPITPEQRSQGLDLTNFLIYPKWNASKLQVNKLTNFLYNNEFYTWLSMHQTHPALQSHRSVLDNTIKLIDPKFLTKDSHGNVLNYEGIFGRPYPVGKLNL